MLRYIVLLAILSISQGYFTYYEHLRLHNNITLSFEDRGHNNTSSGKPVNKGPLPSYLDWRDKEAVSPVKNQKGCNACWAFAIVAAVESHVKIHIGDEEILSEQFLIDCDTENSGCADAPLLPSYGHIVAKLGGILRDEDYFPFEARQRKCRWDPPRKSSTSPGTYGHLKPEGEMKNSDAYPVPVVGFKRVKSNEDEMAAALKHGPITAAINSASMAQYSGGIDEPTDAQCDPGTPDHTILIVGYNEYVPSDPKGRRVKYWIIKNSWGEEWGDNGFYYLVRGRNACGIANDVSMPFVTSMKN